MVRVKNPASGPTSPQMHSCNLNPDPSDSRACAFFDFFKLETKGATSFLSVGRRVLEPTGRILGIATEATGA